MSVFDTTVELHRHLPRHAATASNDPNPDFDWSLPGRLLSPLFLAAGVYGGWAWVAGPFLIDLIGLGWTRAVGVALIVATLWRRS